jgi:dimethylhistidine N-methyltransferase
MLHDVKLSGRDVFAEPDLTGFAGDTFAGLSSDPKFLLPKYFYDDAGSLIFEEITNMPGYYLTGCELEIFSDSQEYITDALLNDSPFFNLIELGPGSGIKTMLLLKSLLRRNSEIRYFPVDISSKANEQLVHNLRKELPIIEIFPFTGDYLNLPGLNGSFGNMKKIFLFLGSNIGNMDDRELNIFLSGLSAYTFKGDKILIGFDLKKSPGIIMKAYDDPYGLTRKFNMNHLLRINRELDADFDTGNFEHYTTYDPISGEVRSYLVSTIRQTVKVKGLKADFEFRKWEPVYMELSRKFDIVTIAKIAERYGFRVDHHFTDSRNYFVDSLWTRI